MFESGKIRTELIWTDKRREKEPLPVLPFQYIETVNEPRTKTMDYFYDIGNTSSWHNLLIWGDNKLVMNSLVEKFAGKINLIYIDPPFATGADFSMPIKIEEEKFTKEPSAIEVKVYRDTWGQGLASYLQMIYDRLVLMKELLAETGTIYVHLDYRVIHYVKLIMDEIFGKDNLLNEVIWAYRIQGIAQNTWARKHETLLFYAKNIDNYYFEPQKERVYYEKPFFSPAIDEQGRYYRDVFIRDVWDHDETKPFISGSKEYLGFPTQKPEGLLNRIIHSCSKEGDLVADFFCGSGTTLAVAEKLKRRWIGCDISKFAINVTRKRLLEIPDCKPFHILNLGKYQKYMLVKNGNGGSRYLRFILQLYKATPIRGFAYLHGKKDNRLVHVGSVDSFVSVQEVKDTVREAENVNVSGIDILGWDFEMGLHDLLDSIIRQYGKDIKLKTIPNTVLDIDLRKSKSIILDEIRFFDLNYLDITHDIDGKVVKVYIKRFNIANPEYIPEDIRNNIKDFTSYIDYWAVDFDYKGDTFHNIRQEYRTRNNPKFKTSIAYEYDKPGKYDILVKVVDILGNDTNKLLTVGIN